MKTHTYSICAHTNVTSECSPGGVLTSAGSRGLAVRQREVLGSVVLLEQILIGSVTLTLHLRPPSPALTIMARHSPECSCFKCTSGRVTASAETLLRISVAVHFKHNKLWTIRQICLHFRKIL